MTRKPTEKELTAWSGAFCFPVTFRLLRMVESDIEVDGQRDGPACALRRWVAHLAPVIGLDTKSPQTVTFHILLYE